MTDPLLTMTSRVDARADSSVEIFQIARPLADRFVADGDGGNRLRLAIAQAKRARRATPVD